MSSFTSRPFTFDRVVRIVAGFIILAGVIWLVGYLSNVLLPFCLACLIAYFLEPLVELHQRWFRTRRRAVPVLFTLVEATVVIGVLLYFFIPSVISEVRHLGALLERSTSTDVSVPFVPEHLVNSMRKWVATVNIQDILGNSHFESLLDSSTSFLAQAIDVLLHTLEWLLTFIYIIFILIDYPSLMAGFRSLVPRKYRRVVFRVGDDLKNNMNRYFRSQAVIAACAAVFYCIGFSIVGIPMAIVLGVTVGILYMIPYFQYVTIIPVAIVCLIDSMTGSVHFWAEFGQCILVYAVSQSICDYVLTPKIMGKAMGLNPAIILLSLSVWGTLLGIIGMIIALPLTTILLAYYQEFIGTSPEPSATADEKK